MLIEYKQQLEENDREKTIDIKFTEQKFDPEMMKMQLTLYDQMYKEKSRKTLLWLTSLTITKANWQAIILRKK